eukprot:TRINITY_DN23367_c0_g2_i1.p1 TRINITY_DN23367_c0_g2~~TRINITY_DN23367_c0_g2_i1.p1  ORF type:complete len:541 (+),score=105.88 TRINITY_DN23367_c0_g2_i1:52-1623(+)
MPALVWLPSRYRNAAGMLSPNLDSDSEIACSASKSSEQQQDGFCEGFRTEPELPALALDSEHVADFSLPQEALQYEPESVGILAKYKNGDGERLIHLNVRLLDHEQEQLRQLRALAAESGRAFYPSVAVLATRYLSKARGDPKKALKAMLATQEWRQSYFSDGPVAYSAVAEDLAHGIVYFAGRDCYMRPALVVRPARVPRAWFADKRALTDRVVRMLVFCMEYLLRYLALPGSSECSVVLVDLAGMTLSQANSNSLSALTAICNVMSNHYTNRVSRFYVLNVSYALSSAAWLGLRFLTERQQQKLRVLRNPQELRKVFALHQLEADLGGDRPVLERFFPFPLLAGPFQAGYEGGPSESAVPRVHEALTAEAMRGKLWDHAQSNAANAALALTEAAPDILRRCGLEGSFGFNLDGGCRGGLLRSSGGGDRRTMEASASPPARARARTTTNGTDELEKESIGESVDLEDGKSVGNGSIKTVSTTVGSPEVDAFTIEVDDPEYDATAHSGGWWWFPSCWYVRLCA